MISKLIVLLISAGLTFLPPSNIAQTNSKSELIATVPITVSKQQSVYEKYSSSQKTCNNCGGSGQVTGHNYNCSYCGGSGSVNCNNSDCPFGSGWHECQACITKVKDSKCNGTGKVAAKGSYIEDVITDTGNLPSNGKHTDGYWYVFKENVED